MKKAIFIALLVTTSAQAQQSTLRGTVAVFNSQFETGTRRYIANAQVEEDYGKSQATTTTADGSFHLPLVGLKDQESVFYSVKKTGYEVVNTDALQAVAGQADTQWVFMAPEGKIAENKLKYYRINRAAAEKALIEKLKPLEKEILAMQSDQIKLRQLQAEYDRLQAQFEQIDEMARDLAGRYARTNLDQVSAGYRRAFRYFQQGQLDSALLIFNAAGLESDASVIISEQSRNAELAAEYKRRDSEKNKWKVETMITLRFKAQLHQTQFAFEETEYCYRLMLRLDSNDTPALRDYANYLSSQSRYDSAVLFCQKWIDRAVAKEEKATAYNNLGTIYRSNQNASNAESAYKTSLKIFRDLNKTNKGVFLPAIALVLNNLGNYYRNTDQIYRAKEVLTESLDIYRQLIISDEAQYLPYLALALNNLGRYYFDHRNMLPARNAFNESLDIYQKLADKNPNAIIPENIQTFYNLTMTFSDNEKLDYKILNIEYETLLKKALKTHEQLAIGKPDIFLPFVALTLSNLGNYYVKQRQIADAEKSYQKALEILSGFAERNPNAFLPFVASVLISKGKFYFGEHKYSESESAYLKSLEIYQSMSILSPKAFLPKIAILYDYLGILKNTNSEYTAALQYYREEFNTRKTIGVTRENAFLKEWKVLQGNIVNIKHGYSDAASKDRAGKFLLELDSIASGMYEDQARKALFTRDFVIAEDAADSGLRFGGKRTNLNALLVIALVFQNRFKEAQKRCHELIDIDPIFSPVCLKELEHLEDAGITHSNIPKVRKLLQQK